MLGPAGPFALPLSLVSCVTRCFAKCCPNEETAPLIQETKNRAEPFKVTVRTIDLGRTGGNAWINIKLAPGSKVSDLKLALAKELGRESDSFDVFKDVSGSNEKQKLKDHEVVGTLDFISAALKETILIDDDK